MKTQRFKFEVVYRRPRRTWRTWLRLANAHIADAEFSRLFWRSFPIRTHRAALRLCREARQCLDRAERAAR